MILFDESANDCDTHFDKNEYDFGEEGKLERHDIPRRMNSYSHEKSRTNYSAEI